MSAQELLQGICHSGAAASSPSAPWLLLVQFHHWVVPWMFWKHCCHLQQCCRTKKVTYLGLYSSIFPNCSHIYLFYSVHSVFFLFPPPVSPPEVTIDLHLLACLPWDIFYFGCWDPGVQDTMQLLSTPFAVSEMKFSLLI